MNQGFILLHRKIRDSALWPKNKPFTKTEAWLDLMMMARFDKEPIEILLGNEIVMCGRGQIVKSINTYQKQWNWGAQRVKSFFEILLKLKQIEKKTTTKTTIITICNYDSYQSEQQTENKRKANGKQTESKRITTKKQCLNNEEQLNNENKEQRKVNNVSEIEDLKKIIFKAYNFNEINFHRQNVDITEFCETVDIKHAKIQIENYFKFSAQDDNKYRVNYSKLIGSSDILFSDGVWNKENWIEKSKTKPQINEFDHSRLKRQN